MKHKTNVFKEEYCGKNQSQPPVPPKIPHRAPLAHVSRGGYESHNTTSAKKTSEHPLGKFPATGLYIELYTRWFIASEFCYTLSFSPVDYELMAHYLSGPWREMSLRNVRIRTFL